MTIIFGLLSAFSYGYADFVGAIAAKKVRALAVTTVAFVFGLTIAVFLSLMWFRIFGQTNGVRVIKCVIVRIHLLQTPNMDTL